jgi:hypothetical protein
MALPEWFEKEGILFTEFRDKIRINREKLLREGVRLHNYWSK